MSRKFTASDRSALIRLASTLPAGSEVRKAILKGLAKRAAASQFRMATNANLAREVADAIRDWAEDEGFDIYQDRESDFPSERPWLGVGIGGLSPWSLFEKSEPKSMPKPKYVKALEKELKAHLRPWSKHISKVHMQTAGSDHTGEYGWKISIDWRA